ncbi:hypothetical protein FRC04_005200 [Tulasnella sp. 424]|nr:hypothetical protein FRC04_005200 [Tulasnella sp. 424]
MVPSPLDVPELLSLVLGHLDRESLVTCCLVCKRWWTWSAEVIWGTNPVAMTAILKLLAPVEIQDPRYGLGTRIQTTFDAISASRWSRTTFYSHKVRSLELSISLDSSSINLIRRLETTYGERLLPKISSVVVEAMVEQSETLSLAFGSALNSASFVSTSSTDDQLKMISLLGSTLGSQISSLMIIRRALPPPDLSQFPQLKQLRYKHAFPIHNWFHIAAACPRLRKLSFSQIRSLSGQRSGQTTEGQETRAIFPELESLQVVNWRVSYFLDIIERSTMPSLRDVDLSLAWSTEDDAITTLNRLRARTPHLSSLSLFLPQEFSAEILRQVLSWRGLFQLRVYPLTFGEMSMEDLEEILPLGAQLERLHLWQETERRPGFPIWALMALARHLVHLVDLQITVDMKDFGTNATVAPNFSPFRMLKTLHIEIFSGLDRLGDVSPALVTFLVTICPSLEKITIRNGDQSRAHAYPLEDMYWELQRQGESRERI